MQELLQQAEGLQELRASSVQSWGCWSQRSSSTACRDHCLLLSGLSVIAQCWGWGKSRCVRERRSDLHAVDGTQGICMLLTHFGFLLSLWKSGGLQPFSLFVWHLHLLAGTCPGLHPCGAVGASAQNAQHQSHSSGFYPQPCVLLLLSLTTEKFQVCNCTQSPRRRRPQAELLCCCRGVVSPGPFIWHCSSLRRSANLPQLSVITALLIHLLILDL